MKWNTLSDQQQLVTLREASHENPVLIYKHSTRCSTSSVVFSRLERHWNENEIGNITAYFLDLIRYRDVSNAVASMFNVPHESPQVLLIRNGESIGDFSHFEIDYRVITDFLRKTGVISGKN